MSEERKRENEQCYKNEIKYLIDKLLRAKSRLSKAVLLDESDGSDDCGTSLYDQSFASA